jgi:hypothetical protein
MKRTHESLKFDELHAKYGYPSYIYHVLRVWCGARVLVDVVWDRDSVSLLVLWCGVSGGWCVLAFSLVLSGSPLGWTEGGAHQGTGVVDK